MNKRQDHEAYRDQNLKVIFLFIFCKIHLGAQNYRVKRDLYFAFVTLFIHLKFINIVNFGVVDCLPYSPKASRREN